MIVDFSLYKYEKLCASLQNLSYHIMPVADYIEQSDKIKGIKKIAIIRHDVDRFINNAEIMAELEKNLAIRSTYYFRISAIERKPLLRNIYFMGHEIGYHYEVMSTCRGNHTLSQDLFIDELSRFRRIVPIKTVSMHGSPLSPYNNLDLWENFSFLACNLIGEASISLSDHIYLTDTARRWDGKHNLRDHLPEGIKKPENIVTTDDLIDYITEYRPSPLYLNIHPERWNNGIIKYCSVYLMDTSFTFGKKVIHLLGKR